MKKSFKEKDVIVFDLDGTLAKSKMPIDREIARLLVELIKRKKVAIISGARFQRFRYQVLKELKNGGKNDYLRNLFIFPTDGAMLFCYRNGRWREVYERELSHREIREIEKDFKIALKSTKFTYPKHDHGPLVENRRTAVTFSALGQSAPLREKERWNVKTDTRKKIIKVMKTFLPGFEIDKAGLTSIDVMKKGVNKGYAIMKTIKILRVPRKKALFIGDALFPGGNDYPAREAHVQCVTVSGPKDTKRVIRKILH
ncbi:MAG: HAD-IIB family hydrolase [Minisyncoccia bacterium]